MRTSEIAETYARSLFDLASLTDSVTVADEQLAGVVKTVRGHVDLRDALAELQKSVADLSVAVAGKLIGAKLSAAEHAGLIDKAIEEVGSLK